VARRHGGDRRLSRQLRGGSLLLVFRRDAGHRRIFDGLGFFSGADHQPVESLDAADQSTQEANQQHEDHAEHQLPGGPEMQRGLQEVAQMEPHRRADQRSELRAGAADRGLHHQLPGRLEREGFGMVRCTDFFAARLVDPLILFM
jgi:hypothetical protein